MLWSSYGQLFLVCRSGLCSEEMRKACRTPRLEDCSWVLARVHMLVQRAFWKSVSETLVLHLDLDGLGKHHEHPRACNLGGLGVNGTLQKELGHASPNRLRHFLYLSTCLRNTCRNRICLRSKIVKPTHRGMGRRSPSWQAKASGFCNASSSLRHLGRGWCTPNVRSSSAAWWNPVSINDQCSLRLQPVERRTKIPVQALPC